MRTLVTLFILAALCGLIVWQFNTQKIVLEKHQQKQQVVAAPQESDQQRQCADTALARYRTLGLQSHRPSAWKGHYNTGLSQCYALIESTDTQLDTIWKRVTLYDGDGKVFGTYAWHSVSDRRASDVPPFDCDVTMPGGDHRSCSSETEFRDLAETYMR